MSNKDLAYAYKIANKRYFGNTLPNLPVKFSDLKNGPMGYTWVNHKFEPKYIEISKELRKLRSVAILTVLHEMVHVENPSWNGHGWRFDRRMKELAKAGAFNGLW